jgi:alanine racemase
MRSEELGKSSDVNLASRRRPGALTSIPLTSRAWVEVDLASIAANVRCLRAFVRPRTRLLAVVKADAYGHGATQVARTVLSNGASALGVATIDEAIALRDAGISAPILILGCVHGTDAIAALAVYDLTPTICSVEHAREIAAGISDFDRLGLAPAISLPLGVHVKIDTGMNRLGTPWTETATVLGAVLARSRWLRVTGFYSHLASADAANDESSLEQLTRFRSAVRAARAAGMGTCILHLANSAATLADSEFHFDLVRIGLAIYGLAPAPHLEGIVPLSPAMTVKARIGQIRRVGIGEGISYGGIFVAERPILAATVGIGYADGVPCRLSQRMTALVSGQRVRQLGRITMDQLVLDVTTVPGVSVGDEVTLLGADGDETIHVEEWARALDTISWEIPCLFKSRLPRVAMFSLGPLRADESRDDVENVWREPPTVRAAGGANAAENS